VHSPEICYPSNGYRVINGEETVFVSDRSGAHKARFIAVERDDARLYCLYWYQVGDTTFWESDGQRRVVQSFRGRDTWPPMVKVMLQTSAKSPDEAQGRLKDLASLVYAWTRAYH
jgi:hypothetical protein